MLKEYTVEDVGYYGCIYKLTSPSGKCYIGQSWKIKNRWMQYKNLNKNIKLQPKLYNALKKYNPENFIFQILDLCQTQIEMDNKECFYIELYDSMNNGYNQKEGGSHGRHTKETCEKISKLLKGHIVSIETRKTISTIKKSKNLIGVNNKLYKINRPKYVINKILMHATWKKNFKLTKSQYTSKIYNLKNSLSKNIYKLYDQYGIIYIVKNLADFCKIHKLDCGHMSAVINKIGNRKHHKGWTGEKMEKTKENEFLYEEYIKTHPL